MSTPLRCECDYDYEDGRYHKASRYCPTHDECEEQCGRMGQTKDPTTSRGARWLCHECVLAEALDEYATSTCTAIATGVAKVLGRIGFPVAR